MKLVQFVKPGLFVYECVRFIIILFLFLMVIRETLDRSLLSMMLIFAGPTAFFSLMALFIWLDTDRYKAYLPLFIAGKCIGIVILLLWSIITKQVIIIQSYIISGDLFSLAAILLIIRDFRKSTEPQFITDEVSGG